MNRLYAFASIGFCVASAAVINVGIGSSKRGNPEDRTRVHRQGEDRGSGVGREQCDDHHGAAGWIFKDGPNRIERFHVLYRK